MKAKKVRIGQRVFIPELSEWAEIIYVARSRDFYAGRRTVTFRDKQGRYWVRLRDDKVKTRGKGLV